MMEWGSIAPLSYVDSVTSACNATRSSSPTLGDRAHIPDPLNELAKPVPAPPAGRINDAAKSSA